VEYPVRPDVDAFMSSRMMDTIDRARDELRYEPTQKRVRAALGDDTIVDSTRALLVWEPRRISPTFAVPAADVRAELLPAHADADGEAPDLLHPGIPFAVHSWPGAELTLRAGPVTRERAAFRPVDPDLGAYVLLDFDAFDAWYEEDERLFAHPRDPFHRIDIRPSSRHVRIEVDGELIADSTRPTLVFETRLPVRFYLPREDLLVDLLPSEKRTCCPYKGHASYWSVGVDGRRHDDVAWTYTSTLPDSGQLRDLVAFFDELVDVIVDGKRRERPGGVYSAAILEEVDMA
jgi:uncharacterized protein (DUF427 family)